jgi:hypothetical protein
MLSIIEAPICLLVCDNVQLQWKPDRKQRFSLFIATHYTAATTCTFPLKCVAAVGLTSLRGRITIMCRCLLAHISL